jgi:hypothetical protein
VSKAEQDRERWMLLPLFLAVLITGAVHMMALPAFQRLPPGFPEMELLAFGSTVFYLQKPAVLRVRVRNEDTHAALRDVEVRFFAGNSPGAPKEFELGRARSGPNGIATLTVPSFGMKGIWNLHYEVSRLRGVVALSRYAWSSGDMASRPGHLRPQPRPQPRPPPSNTLQLSTALVDSRVHVSVPSKRMLAFDLIDADGRLADAEFANQSAELVVPEHAKAPCSVVAYELQEGGAHGGAQFQQDAGEYFYPQARETNSGVRRFNIHTQQTRDIQAYLEAAQWFFFGLPVAQFFAALALAWVARSKRTGDIWIYSWQITAIVGGIGPCLIGSRWGVVLYAALLFGLGLWILSRRTGTRLSRTATAICSIITANWLAVAFLVLSSSPPFHSVKTAHNMSGPMLVVIGFFITLPAICICAKDWRNKRLNCFWLVTLAILLTLPDLWPSWDIPDNDVWKQIYYYDHE